MATRYPNRDYERRRWRDPYDNAEEREGMWVGVADRERRKRLDDRIRERGSNRPLRPSLDRSDEPLQQGFSEKGPCRQRSIEKKC